MSDADRTSPEERSTIEVMFVPPKIESNTYLTSLADELRNNGIDLFEYTWDTLFPIVGPIYRHGRPDVIHFHLLSSVTIGSTPIRTLLKGVRLVPVILAIKLLGIDVVWTVHNLFSHERRYPRWELFWRSVFAGVVADRLIVHCEAAADAVRETFLLGNRTPITTIQHGHYIGQYPESTPSERALESVDAAEAETVFTFFGQIRPYKQVPKLVETFVELDVNRARLIVAGNPKTESLRRRVESLCAGQSNIETRLEFIPDDEVAQYFAAADIVVLPYRDILTSGSAMLAMSFARPVVAPRIGCLPELVEDDVSGFLYDPDTPDGLRHAMERAVEANDALSEMGERGFETVANWDWASVAERTREVYESN